MMRPIEFGSQTIDVDVEATRAAYRLISSGDADRCECLTCQNYGAVRAQVFPAAARQVLTRLGVDPMKEADLMDVGPLPGGRTRVIGTLHAVGRVGAAVSVAAEAPSPGSALTIEVAPGFSLSVAQGEWQAPEAFDGHPLLLIAFEADVPWVLGEPHPEAATD